MYARIITTPVPLDEQWHSTWALVQRSFRSSLHYAFASVNADGTPHVTPIGSLLLKEDEPTGFYFELFTRQFPHNLEQQPHLVRAALPAGLSKGAQLRRFLDRMGQPDRRSHREVGLIQ